MRAASLNVTLQDSCLGNSTDRGVLWAGSMGSQKVRHNLVTEQQNSVSEQNFLEIVLAFPYGIVLVLLSKIT